MMPLMLMLALGACNVGERLAQVGKAPDLKPIENPTAKPDYRPVSMPMPPADEHRSAGANSLWREGARGFFRDQRARRIGDVLTVNITIADKAALSNESQRSRSSSDNLGVIDFFGFENSLTEALPQPVSPGSLVNADSSMNNRGSGETQRSETIDINLAAVIVQTLPNGNLVVEGRQDIRVNFEAREIYIAGIVRPEDITPQNTIPHDKIAELRVAYGGRGQLTDVQQPRYGAQILDIVLPY